MREDWNMDARVEHHFLHDILEVYFKALHPAAAPIHGFCNDPRNTVWHLLAKHCCRKGIQIVPSFPGTFLLAFHFLLLPQYFAASTANAGKQACISMHLLWKQNVARYELKNAYATILWQHSKRIRVFILLCNLHMILPFYCKAISVFWQRIPGFFVQFPQMAENLEKQ